GGEGAVPEAADGEGVEGGDRAFESRACQRDAEARAPRETAPRSPAGAESDVTAHTRGARGAARDAGAAGRPRARVDEPSDAPPDGKAAEAALAEGMLNPDVGLDVHAAAVLEVDRNEGPRHDVVAVLGEHHP